MTQPPTCDAVIYAGSRFIDPEPPEVCGEPCDPGEHLCPAHLEELE